MQRGRYIHLAMTVGIVALTGWSSQLALAAPPAVTATGLPTGFSAVALGSSTTDAQSVAVDAKGAWTIKAGGDGLNNSNGADGGVGIYQKLSGNGSLIAHVASTSDPAAQVAVVFRADPTDEASPILRNKYSAASLYQPEIRRNSGDTPQAATANNDSTMVGFRGFSGTGADTVPGTGVLLSKSPWIGIDRNGPKFSFYASNDGKVWNLLATAVDGASVYPTDMQVGIEASKNTASAISTITLDGVAVSPALLAPAAITGVSYLPREKSVIVAWNAAAVTGSDVTYNVYSFTKPNASDTPTKLTATPIKDSSFMAESLTDGTAYYFGVTAVVGGVESPLALPLSSVLAAGGIGPATPNPPIAGPIATQLQLYNIGTNTPGTVTVTGTSAAPVYDFNVGGADFWEAGDGGSMLAMPMAGDLDVSCRIVQGPADNGNADGWAQGGPIFRETLDPGSRMVMALASAHNTMELKRRRVENQRPVNTDVSQTGGDNSVRPISMRLVRKGDTFQGYSSEDSGAHWLDLGDPTVTDLASSTASKDTIAGFSKMPYVGLAFSAHQEGYVDETMVDQFVIKPAQ